VVIVVVLVVVEDHFFAGCDAPFARSLLARGPSASGSSRKGTDMSSSIDNSTNRIRTDSKPTDSSSGSGSDSSRHSSSSSSRNSSSSSSSSSMRAALLQLLLVALCTAILLRIFNVL
jgi:cobalamin biosynthesis Mg chelatase CobN